MNKTLRKQFFTFFCAVCLLGNAYSQEFPVELIRYNGPPDEMLNIVIMGDGYTASQQDKFIQDAENAFDGFFAQEPFTTFMDSINVYAIKVVSNAEGASMDPANLIDNYFGSSYWSYNIERLLVAWRYENIVEVLNENTPFYDEAVIIVNNDKYGGSGGEYAVFSTHSQAIELLLHEFGHSFGNLADEYWAGDSYAAEKANMTQDNDPATIRWKDFLYTNGIGIYPYEESPSWYRPHQDCKMRYLGSDFCDVCKNKLSIEAMNIANSGTTSAPIAYFAANKINIQKGDTVQFYDFSAYNPENWEWSFGGGAPATSNEQNPKVSYAADGNYKVSLTVTNSQGEDTETKLAYIFVSSTVNTTKTDYSELIRIYPNPADKWIRIVHGNSAGPVCYEIINTTGVVVNKGVVDGQIDTSGLVPGIYFVKISYDKTSVLRKLIKQ